MSSADNKDSIIVIVIYSYVYRSRWRCDHFSIDIYLERFNQTFIHVDCVQNVKAVIFFCRLDTSYYMGIAHKCDDQPVSMAKTNYPRCARQSRRGYFCTLKAIMILSNYIYCTVRTSDMVKQSCKMTETIKHIIIRFNVSRQTLQWLSFFNQRIRNKSNVAKLLQSPTLLIWLCDSCHCTSNNRIRPCKNHPIMHWFVNVAQAYSSIHLKQLTQIKITSNWTRQRNQISVTFTIVQSWFGCEQVI